jgi:hypothetical protein
MTKKQTRRQINLCSPDMGCKYTINLSKVLTRMHMIPNNQYYWLDIDKKLVHKICQCGGSVSASICWQLKSLKRG